MKRRGFGVVEILIALAIALFFWLIIDGYIQYARQIEACKKSGGEWKVVGQHLENRPQSVGNQTIIVAQVVNDEACVRPR